MAEESFSREIRVTKLSKATYNRWKIEIRDALESHRIWEIASGTADKPQEKRDESGTVTNRREVEEWKAKDSKARSIIRSTLDDTTFDQVCDCESSADILKRIKAINEPKTLNVLLELLREFFSYSWKPDSTVGTFVAGLKVIARRIEALESDDFGRNFNKKLMMAKILGCLPKEFDNFVTSWSLLSEDISLEDFLEKLTNVERSITERSNDTSHEAFKAQSKPGSNQAKKMIIKKFQGKCHKCGKKGHMQKDCWSKSEKLASSEEKKTNEKSKDQKEETSLSASSVFKINKENKILADSGASVHLTGNMEWFSSLRKLTTPLILNVANGKSLQATHVGNIAVEKSNDGRKWEKRTWENVYYAKEMGAESLFSTTFMEVSKGYSFYHGNGIMRLSKGRQTMVGGERIGSQYIPYIRIKPPSISANVARSVGLWHQRLGHVSETVVRAMYKNNLTEGLEVTFSDKNDCESCHYGKQTISRHPNREKRDCLPGQRFHSDVCHIGVVSWNKCKYFLTMKDEASGYRRIFFMKTKDEVSSILRQFFIDAERETGKKAISLRTDNGTEYVNENVEEVLKSMGIIHELSPPNVKQCNGMAERENRTLCDTARSMLFNTDLSRTDCHLLWTEAIGTAAYLRNRVPNRGILNTTPYSEWYGRKPDVSHLRVFGAKAFVHIPNAMRRKMDPKSRKAIFVGYDRLTDKVYRVFDPVKKIVERVSDVVIQDVMDKDQVLFPIPADEQEEVYEELSIAEKDEDEAKLDDDSEQKTDNANEEAELREKKKGRPVGSKNFQKPVPTTDRELRSKSNKSACIAAMKVSMDPVSYEDAISREDAHLWKKAMDEEMLSLTKNQAWELEELPKDRSAVSCKWVFKSKLKPDGIIERYKARLVARGFHQTKGVDYFETFSPVVRYESVRTVLAMAAKFDMEIVQFDIKTAFLNSPLEESIYMHQPEGYEDGTNRVCHLKRSLYGLKQASRIWNNTFNDFVAEYGLIQSDSDPCIFMKNDNADDWMILCLYVDDGLIVCKKKESLEFFISTLKRKFEITCNEPSCYVGMEIKRDRKMKTISVNQQGYISRMLRRFGMEDCKTTTSPVNSSINLSELKEEEAITEKRFPYREAVGCLNYIAQISRPDIAYIVGNLARFANNPSETHWRAAKQVMKYLKGTIDLSLCYNGKTQDKLIGYCDSDYAGDPVARRSTSGYIFMQFGGPIAWSSSLQKVTALSSSEAEYMSMSEALKELLWLRSLLKSLGLEQEEETELKMDNQAAIALSKNPEFHKRSKHIGVRFHRIRQEQEAGNVIVTYVPTDKQIADLLTKGLPWAKISGHLEALRMTS